MNHDLTYSFTLACLAPPLARIMDEHTLDAGLGCCESFSFYFYRFSNRFRQYQETGESLNLGFPLYILARRHGTCTSSIWRISPNLIVTGVSARPCGPIFPLPLFTPTDENSEPAK